MVDSGPLQGRRRQGLHEGGRGRMKRYEAGGLPGLTSRKLCWRAAGAAGKRYEAGRLPDLTSRKLHDGSRGRMTAIRAAWGRQGPQGVAAPQLMGLQWLNVAEAPQRRWRRHDGNKGCMRAAGAAWGRQGLQGVAAPRLMHRPADGVAVA